MPSLNSHRHLEEATPSSGFTRTFKVATASTCPPFSFEAVRVSVTGPGWVMIRLSKATVPESIHYGVVLVWVYVQTGD